VLITNSGRVEQRVIECPGGAGEEMGEETVADLRARLNAAVAGQLLTDVPGLLVDLPDTMPAEDRPAARAVLATLFETLVERNEERVVLAGTPNLARLGHDFAHIIRPVLEALEEQVVLLRLLGEATGPSRITVRIGRENELASLAATSVVTSGYGAGDEVMAKLGVVGPTRMDYPGTMGAVRAVARYVGQIIAGH
jgi:heat-inducible transcriptional repressor